MFDYAQLAALSSVLRTGSFDAAAVELGVTQSAVSQRIKALEERVGAVLVQRGQPCTPTPAGMRFARHTEAVQLLEKGLEQDLGQGRSALATVRLAVNADSLATWFLTALAQAPGLLFDLVIDDQDHSATWLRRGEVAAAVTSHGAPVQGCDSFALGRLQYLAVASPAFIAHWLPDGVTAAAVARAPALTFDAKDQLQAQWLRREAGQRLGYRSHLLPSSQGFVEAAVLGLGWGMNPECLVREHLRDGRLVTLSAQPMDVVLYWQVSRLAAPALAGLTRAVQLAARQVLA